MLKIKKLQRRERARRMQKVKLGKDTQRQPVSMQYNKTEENSIGTNTKKEKKKEKIM